MKKIVYPKSRKPIKASHWGDETWTGGYHYMIQPYKHKYAVMVESYPDKYEIAFLCDYNACKKYLENQLVKNADYDLGI